MGNNIKNVLEINGKRYDAISGSYISSSQAVSHSSQPTIDGFRRAVQPDKSTSSPKQSVHSAARHVAAHKPAPARTLMRGAVRKPTIQSPSQIKAQTRIDILARVPAQTVQPKVSHSSVDPHRQKKAVQMVQSPAIRRYAPGSDTSSFVAQRTPSVTAVGSFTPSTSLAAGAIPVTPEPSRSHQPDIFEQAMARATSHEERFDERSLPKKKRSRLSTLLTAGVSLMLIVGVVAYFNVPALSMRMASTRAGFQAKLPGYSPLGFSFGNLSYGPGNVTVSYKSDDSHKFDITQRTSDWDSQALLSNFVASANKAYQTYERAGRTIYFFGNNTATWVDNGVWYTVNGNNSLSKNQLLDLASSL